MRTAPRWIILLGSTLAAFLLIPAPQASAHPLGNFTVNQYDGIVAAPAGLRIDHVEDLAEIPARQAEPRIDRDGDGRLGRGELRAWGAERCGAAARNAEAAVGGRDVPVRSTAHRARVRPGQAGLFTLRLECRLRADARIDQATTLRYRPGDATTGPGWREITARGDRMTVARSATPQASVSRRLTAYPRDLLSSPPHRTSATLRVTPGGPALADERKDDSASPGAGVLPRGTDRWTGALTSLVARHDLAPGFAALALAISLGLGALHALAPGHGKTLMAAAATAGGRGSLRTVLALGASVTVTHTLGVFALGGLIVAGSAATPAVLGWLGLASGALVTLAGAALVRRAWRRRKAHRAHHHHHHHHDPPPSLRSAILLGFAGGLVPSPSAVVVLVGAGALGRAWFGLLLVIAYGAGLAITLTAAGFAAVRIGDRLTRRHRHVLPARLRRTAPLGSAALVFALGCGLLLKGAATAVG
ncbi:nickel transporter [Streptomyces sp. A7024]|uniref:Nickel transporter n=1 Tax=Streptomyces coryli TaxID=1128680 RepID=A0A6G4UAJ0_9ACTN|nr:sulfite exporter TauE/SafE family protein [Streptomyces coryli]NGN68730.1 nickel transporter [Streptomyces coryli]